MTRAVLPFSSYVLTYDIYYQSVLAMTKYKKPNSTTKALVSGVRFKKWTTHPSSNVFQNPIWTQLHSLSLIARRDIIYDTINRIKKGKRHLPLHL